MSAGWMRACGAAWVVLWTSLAAGQPRVVEATPDRGDVVDSGLAEVRITFDQEMQAGSHSFCGGGPAFPKVTGQPRWVDARTVVLPVSLEPGRRYDFSINCPAARGFRSAAGEAAESYPISFRTAAAGEAAPALAPGRAEELLAELRRVMDERYAHRDVRGVDWDARFAEFEGWLTGARTPAAFARAAAEALRINQDIHTFIEVNGVRLATGRRGVTPNVDGQVLKRTVPGFAEVTGGAVGRFQDGIGYIAIPAWSGEGDTAVAGILDALHSMIDARGLVVDVRMNSGGNELLARRIAGCFVEEMKVYSTNLIRDPEAPGGWAGPFERKVEPAAQGPHFRERVAVLMGPACMSSCESFVLMMREPGKRELFGAASWGSSGNPRPHEIGEGITVYFASWRDMTAEGEPIEGVGIQPDHGIEWKAGETDPVLEAALAWLREP